MTYYLAVEDSNAGIATVLQYTAPVMIMVLLALKNWKLPGKNEILALILAFGGTVLLATHGNLTQLSVSKTTLIFGLSSAVATIFYNLVPGNLMDIYGTFPMVGWGMLISGIGLTPFVRPWTLVEDITWDWQCIGCIVVVIIFGTVMSFSCYMEGVRLIGGSKASLLARAVNSDSNVRDFYACGIFRNGSGRICRNHCRCDHIVTSKEEIRERLFNAVLG